MQKAHRLCAGGLCGILELPVAISGCRSSLARSSRDDGGDDDGAHESASVLKLTRSAFGCQLPRRVRRRNRPEDRALPIVKMFFQALQTKVMAPKCNQAPTNAL
jgi:hypothetical protein